MSKKLPAGITTRQHVVKGKTVRQYRAKMQDLSRRTASGNYAQLASRWFSTQREAQRWLDDQHEEARRHGSIEVNRSMTVGEACEAWITAATTVGINGKPPLEEATARRYRSTIRCDITGRIDALKIASLRASEVKRWVDALATDKTHDAAHRALNVLRLALAHQVTLDTIGHNPARDVRISKAGRRQTDEDDETQTVEHFMDTATVQKMLAAADQMTTADSLPNEGRGYGEYQRQQRRDAWIRWRVLVYFLIATGVRIAEAAALRWGNVDLEAGTVRITHARKVNGTIGPPKTLTSIRTITLGSGITAMLRDLKGDADADHFVFGRSKQAMVPEGFSKRAWKPMMVLAGLMGEDGTPLWGRHDCRHYHASLLIREGVPVQQVSERLGHSNTTVTLKVYAHLFRDMAGAGNTAGAQLEGKLFGLRHD